MISCEVLGIRIMKFPDSKDKNRIVEGAQLWLTCTSEDSDEWVKGVEVFKAWADKNDKPNLYAKFVSLLPGDSVYARCNRYGKVTDLEV